MTTKTELNNPIEVTQKPWVTLSLTQILVAIAMLVVGFMGGVFANTQLNLIRQPVTGAEVNPPRALEAEAARYTGLAGVYNAENKASERALEAEANRYSGLATYYGVENQRALAAETARYSGLATYYGVENQRALEAETARYTGLATQYASGMSAGFLAANPELLKVQSFNTGSMAGPSLLDTDPARLLAHRSAEVRAIAGTLLLAANPELMAARRYNPVETRVDPNSDIGLLEFASVPGEMGGQRPASSDANADIGLLEFFAAPARHPASPLVAQSVDPTITPDVERAEAYFLAANSGVQDTRPAAIIERQKIDAVLLGENPELLSARRYAAQVEWDHIHHPGR